MPTETDPATPSPEPIPPLDPPAVPVDDDGFLDEAHLDHSFIGGLTDEEG